MEKGKSKLTILFIVVLLVFTNSISLSISRYETIEVLFNSINIKANGKDIGSDNILYNNTTYVPLRKVAEMLDKEVVWNEKTRTVNILNKGSCGIDGEGYEVDDYKLEDVNKFIDNSYDTFILRHDANFLVELAKGVYWVPVNALGNPQYKDTEILELVNTRNPALIKGKINTLYDAIQYFYISGFKSREVDNFDIIENGISWEHHKTGEEALLTNYGDCSGHAALLNYLLEGDYDEVGFISYNQPNGSGHVFNYIKEDEYYYIIDMTMLPYATTETGRFGNTVTIGTQGNLHKVKDLKDYIEFYNNIINPDALIFETYINDRVMPISSQRDGNKVTYYFPDNMDVKVISNKAFDNIKIVYTEPPKNIPKWDTNNLEPLFNRTEKAKIQIIPKIQYSEYILYNELNCDIYFKVNNEVTTEMISVELKYYDKDNNLIHTKLINQEELDTHYSNTFIFKNREGLRLGTWNAPHSTSKIIGFLKGKDFNGHIINEQFMIDFSNIKDLEAGYNYSLNKPSPYDAETLKYYADFKLPVFPGVMWVPVNVLGKPDLTKEDILKLGNDPKELQKKIDTLYEVILYIQAVDFKSANDNIRIREDNISWEHHKPGELAITTKEGCCATISNLLNYLLKEDYDDVGFIAYSQEEGNGHVFNYIKHDDKYYIIDLTHYRNDFMNTAIEDGNYDNYYRTDFIAGNLHEVSDIKNYVSYCINYYNNPPELFSMYSAENVLPIDSVKVNDEVKIVYPETYKENVNIIYDDPDDHIYYDFVKPPVNYPEQWEPYNTKY